MFAQRLAGHSAARITRALNDAGVPCPPASDPARNPHRAGTAWTLRTVAAILANPRYTAARCGTGSRPIRSWSTPPTPGSGTGRCSGGTCPRAGSSPSTRACGAGQRSRLHRRPGHHRAARPRWPGRRAVPAGRAARLRSVRAAAGIGVAQRQARLPVPPRSLSATVPDPTRPKNTYLREDQILPRLAAIAILRADARTPDREREAGITAPAQIADMIDELRAHGHHAHLRPGHPHDQRGRHRRRHHRRPAQLKYTRRAHMRKETRKKQRAPDVAGGRSRGRRSGMPRNGKIWGFNVSET